MTNFETESLLLWLSGVALTVITIITIYAIAIQNKPTDQKIFWLLMVIFVPLLGAFLFWMQSDKFRIFLKYWLPMLIWMAVIFAASSDAKSFEHSSRLLAPLLRWLFPQMSEDTVHFFIFLARKCAHVAEYAMFALLVRRALNQSKNNLTPWSWPKVGGTLLIVFLYAASDEFHQIFVPTRTPAIHDVVIDTIGGAIGLFALWLVGRWRKRW
jgi:VanZ family protein